MRVWRVAHENARTSGFPAGPYAYGGALDEATAERIDSMRWDHCGTRHPCPRDDSSLGDIAERERCGFNSREALDGWFDGWTKTLSECGFRIWVYDAPDWACRVGEHGQTLFVADEAVEVRTEPFTWAVEQLPLPA
ncbi:hypothetical protein F0344_04865 [Streptomyces finlayi]|uniref:Uncharacterized protein n=1 Tax=Streptomyces finlayi TaxID=67296 RepID=A0A7G7BFA8_9ACTN|nr:hypothetical protein [Streptomyces finlayi]QNE74023.1 hypothetical protein F0344_04865 [Streptomyces finlayi]